MPVGTERNLNAVAKKLIYELIDLSDAERLEVFAALQLTYCFGCGGLQPQKHSCQCQNDE